MISPIGLLVSGVTSWCQIHRSHQKLLKPLEPGHGGDRFDTFHSAWQTVPWRCNVCQSSWVTGIMVWYQIHSLSLSLSSHAQYSSRKNLVFLLICMPSLQIFPVTVYGYRVEVSKDALTVFLGELLWHIHDHFYSVTYQYACIFLRLFPSPPGTHTWRLCTPILISWSKEVELNNMRAYSCVSSPPVPEHTLGDNVHPSLLADRKRLSSTIGCTCTA